MAAAVKRCFASNMKRYLVPLVRPAADSPLIRLKRMRPGCPHAHLNLSSLPFFERDCFNRFQLTRKFSEVIRRWADYREPMADNAWVNTPECGTHYLNLSGMDPEKMKVGFRDIAGTDDFLDFLVSGDADLTFGYLAPDNRYRVGIMSIPGRMCNYKMSDVKAEFGRISGELKVTLPKLPKSEVVPPVIPQGCYFSVNVTVIDDL